MAVTYVGAGTYASGNNAAVTPGIPAGVQAGDLLVGLGYIREFSGVTTTLTAGWTIRANTNNSIDGTFVLFAKFATGSDTAPTLTFTGAGSNDTTQARIYAFRGTASGSLSDNTVFSWASATGGNSTSAPYALVSSGVAGSAHVLTYGFANDITLTQGSTPVTEFDSNNLIPADWNIGNIFEHNLTALGADAALGICGFICKYSIPNPSYFQIQPTSSGQPASNGILYLLEIKASGTTYTYAGTGGAKVGGSASTSYLSPIKQYTGTGGVKVGGSASYSYRPAIRFYTGTGGVKVGGAASTMYHKPVKTYTGSGGVKIGGSATATYIHPTIYYINPATGSDANNGSSWALAFKSFRPLADKTYPLGPGDIVKVAKSGDTVSSGITVSPVYHTGSMTYSLSEVGVDTAGFSNASTLIPLWSPVSSRVTVVHNLDGTSGVTVAAGAEIRNDNVYYATKSPQLCIFYSTQAVGAKLCHAATTANLNLSTFGRLEMFVSTKLVATGANTTNGSLALWLCSDTAGEVPLLQLTVPLTGLPGNIWSYEGTLPSGVNSISFRVGGELMRQQMIFVRCLVACLPYSSADYFGLFTQFKYGTHEGSVFHINPGFYRSGSNVYLRAFYSCLPRQPDYANTNRSLFYRKATAMAIQWAESNIDTNTAFGPQIPGYSAYSDIKNYCGLRTAFEFNGMNGLPSTPITIEGGYDPISDTVTGVTALIGYDTGRYYSYSYGYNTGIGAYLFDSSSYITIKNIDTFEMSTGTMHVTPSESHHITFENCTMVSAMPSSDEGSLTYGNMRAHTLSCKLDPTDIYTKFHDITFKNCTGSLYLFWRVVDPLPGSMLYNLTYENCIWVPYHGRTKVQESYTTGCAPPLTTPATVIGTLKIYSVIGSNDPVGYYTRHVKIPPLVDGGSATVYIYNGGTVWLPAYAAPGVYTGTQTYPTLVLENTVPIFYAPLNELMFMSRSYTASQAGLPEKVVFPSMTLHQTNAVWALDMSSMSYYTPIIPNIILQPSRNSFMLPPIEIQSLSLTGTPYANSSYANALFGALTRSTAISVGSLTASSGWQVVLQNGTYAGETGAMHEDGSLAILHASTLPNPITITSSSVSFCRYANGNVDVRNASFIYANTNSPSFAPDDFIGTVSFFNCTLRRVDNGAIVTGWSGTGKGYYSASPLHGPMGEQVGVFIEDSTIPLGTNVTTATRSLPETAISTVTTGLPPLTRMAFAVKSGATHTVYRNTHILSKDTTTYISAPASWKSVTTMTLYTRWSNAYKIGSVPVQSGKAITFSINLRRATVTNHVLCLFVVPHGSAGNLPADYVEKVALHTAGANVWQEVTITYNVIRSIMVDIYVGHYGSGAGLTGWFDNVRVLEA